MSTKQEWQDLLRRTPELAQRYRWQRFWRLVSWSAGGGVTAGVVAVALVSAHQSSVTSAPVNASPSAKSSASEPVADSDTPGSGSANGSSSDRVGVYDRADPPRMQEIQANH